MVINEVVGCEMCSECVAVLSERCRVTVYNSDRSSN